MRSEINSTIINHQKCLICEGSILNRVPWYSKHDLVKCKHCGLVFMRQIPSAQDLQTHYGSYSYGREHYLSPLTILSYNNLLDEFEKFRKTNKILDIGCGLGFFLGEAKKRGWEVHGTEFSEMAVNRCKEKGFAVEHSKLEVEMFRDDDFDVITSFEVIEHINDPVEELEKIHLLLRQGGLFYCTTPNFNALLRYYLKEKYNIIGYPEHLTYYTKKTLNKVVTARGFKRHKFLTTGISITRFKTSKGISNERLISESSSDEILRQKLASRWYLQALKHMANFMLTLTNCGMTLKGYYIKW